MIPGLLVGLLVVVSLYDTQENDGRLQTLDEIPVSRTWRLIPKIMMILSPQESICSIVNIVQSAHLVAI